MVDTARSSSNSPQVYRRPSSKLTCGNRRGRFCANCPPHLRDVATTLTLATGLRAANVTGLSWEQYRRFPPAGTTWAYLGELARAGRDAPLCATGARGLGY